MERLIAARGDDLTSQQLDILSSYLIFSMEKQERKKKKILTENRKVTISRRECSLEGLEQKFPKGEDAVYHLISKDNSKDIFRPKISITGDDLSTIPYLLQVREAIEWWKAYLREIPPGRGKYIAKRAVIELQKEQYIIKQAYKKPVNLQGGLHGAQDFHYALVDESYARVTPSREIEVTPKGITLMIPKVVLAILDNYSKLKQDFYDSTDSDIWCLLQDFDDVSGAALDKNPIYKAIVELRIDGKSNEIIAEIIQKQYNKDYSPEYISTLWRQKIPKLISKEAEKDFIFWYCRRHKFPEKKCNKCGQKKPKITTFFSRNGDSKDGFYSICKECRKKKKGSD